MTHAPTIPANDETPQECTPEDGGAYEPTHPALVVPEGYVADARGRFVPQHMVKPEHALEDQMVNKVFDYALDLNAQIERFKAHTFDDVGTYLDILSEKYGVKPRGQKGNMTFTSYDGCKKLQIAVAEHLQFGPELHIAKSLIDECLAEWTEGANANLQAIVNDAFQTDKQGLVNRERIFGLRRLQIDDPRWMRAMEAITDSIRIAGSKTYVRFYRRRDQFSAWEPVTINLASA